MMRSKKIVLVSHCLINQNSVVMPLGRARGAFPIVKALLDEGIGVIQLPCPEFKYLGPSRKPMNKKEYDTQEFRELCKNLFVPVLEDLKKYIEDDYSLVGIIGINHSPTCSITGDVGIFMEEIFKMLKNENIETNYFEIPTDYTEKNDYKELFLKLKNNLKL